jgi:hypothetical protein
MERNPRNRQRARSPGRWLLLVWHELRLALRRPMLHACVALIAIVAALSATLGLRDVAAARHDYAARLQQQVEAQLQPEAVMGWNADVRLRAIRSPVTGAALARGVEPSLPLYWDFSPSGVRWGPEPPSRLYVDGGIPFDFGMLFLTIGGLLAGMFGVDVIARARATGTLRARLSLPVPPTLVVSATLTAAALVVAYAVVVVQLAVVAAMAMSRPAGLDVPTRETLLLVEPMGVPALLFLCFMMTLGASIRLLAQTDAAAYLTQIALWGVIALLMPYLVPTAARMAVPAASRGALEHAASETLANRLHDAESRLGVHLLARTNGAPDPGVLNAAIERHRAALEDLWTDAAREARMEVKTLERDWWEARRRQGAVRRWLGWLSPGTLLLRSVDAAAGTGPALADTWERAVEDYQERLNGDLFDDRPRATIRLPADAGGHWVRFDRRRAPKLQALPQFQPPRPQGSAGAGDVERPVIGLAVYLLAMVAIAARLFATRLIGLNSQLPTPSSQVP